MWTADAVDAVPLGTCEDVDAVPLGTCVDVDVGAVPLLLGSDVSWLIASIGSPSPGCVALALGWSPVRCSVAFFRARARARFAFTTWFVAGTGTGLVSAARFEFLHRVPAREGSSVGPSKPWSSCELWALT